MKQQGSSNNSFGLSFFLFFSVQGKSSLWAHILHHQELEKSGALTRNAVARHSTFTSGNLLFDISLTFTLVYFCAIF